MCLVWGVGGGVWRGGEVEGGGGEGCGVERKERGEGPWICFHLLLLISGSHSTKHFNLCFDLLDRYG